MISKVKDLMAISEKLEGISEQVGSVKCDVDGHSEGIARFMEEISALRSEVKDINKAQSRFCSSVESQISSLTAARQDLEKEVYDFKLIKADIKSRLVAELADDFREQMKKETAKLDVDVKRFNELKDELSRLVGKFRSVEDEIAKFKAIAQDIRSADFELARHAKELTKADEEKLKLMQRIDHLERLVSKMRRSSR
jgi:archaellum component FlaC